MEANFARALHVVLGEEGGYSNNSLDPGGETCLGVTKRTWESWTGLPATSQDMRGLTGDMVSPLYHARYWKAAGCDGLADGLDLLMFDSSVNCGVARAVKWLQTAAGSPPDGQIGPATLTAARAYGAAVLIDVVSAERNAHYQRLPSFQTFGHGWLGRLGRIAALAHHWAEGEPPAAA